MKHLFFLLTSVALLASCGNKQSDTKEDANEETVNTVDDYSYRTVCSKDEMYHEHNFEYYGDYTESSVEFGIDGWYLLACTKCGLQQKFNTDLQAKGKDGAIELYKNPKTGKFDDLCVSYKDVRTTITPDDLEPYN